MSPPLSSVPVVCGPPNFIVVLQVPETNALRSGRAAEDRGVMAAGTCSLKKRTALNSQETKLVLGELNVEILQNSVEPREQN